MVIVGSAKPSRSERGRVRDQPAGLPVQKMSWGLTWEASVAPGLVGSAMAAWAPASPTPQLPGVGFPPWPADAGAATNRAAATTAAGMSDFLRRFIQNPPRVGGTRDATLPNAGAMRKCFRSR